LDQLRAPHADERVALAHPDAPHVRLVDAGPLGEEALEVRGARALAATDVDEDLREVTVGGAGRRSLDLPPGLDRRRGRGRRAAPAIAIAIAIAITAQITAARTAREGALLTGLVAEDGLVVALLLGRLPRDEVGVALRSASSSRDPLAAALRRRHRR